MRFPLKKKKKKHTTQLQYYKDNKTTTPHQQQEWILYRFVSDLMPKAYFIHII